MESQKTYERKPLSAGASRLWSEYQREEQECQNKRERLRQERMEQREEALRQAVFCEGGFRKGEDHCKETGGQAVPDPGGQYYPRQFLQASDEMYNGKGHDVPYRGLQIYQKAL